MRSAGCWYGTASDAESTGNKINTESGLQVVFSPNVIWATFAGPYRDTSLLSSLSIELIEYKPPI